jgi:hypothetical protein
MRDDTIVARASGNQCGGDLSGARAGAKAKKIVSVAIDLRGEVLSCRLVLRRCKGELSG